VTLTILADENIPAVESHLGAFARIQRCSGREVNRSLLKGVDVLLVRSVTRVDEALLRGSTVRFVGTATSGFDHIDRSYLARAGIGFAYAPGSNANSVVEYVMAAIASVDDKLEQLLAGGSLGIVGYGTIGKAVAARFRALGIQCRISDPWLDQSTIPHSADLSAVLACDVVTLHAELTTAQPWPSYHLLGRDALQRLRPDGLLINACRGPVIDNPALLAHLELQQGPATVLDVWEGEPAIDAALLAQASLGTAHIAGYSWDGKLQATRQLSTALAAHLGLPSPARTAAAVDADVAPIAVPNNLSTVQLIRFLLQAQYDIRLDDALLREAVSAGATAANNGASFDTLRKSYRQRRELAGSRILGLCSEEHLGLAQALGCIPGEASQPL
jgi:erythronate-4-phosphate dehydrogenase